VVGRHHQLFVDRAAAARPEYEQFWSALRQGVAQQGEFRRRGKRREGKAGAYVWFSATYTPIIMDGRVWKIVKFARDITQEKLRNADFEGQIGAISRTQAVVSFTPEGIITDFSDIFLQIVGYTREKVLGQHHRFFMDSQTTSRPAYEEFWSALRAGAARQGDFRYVNERGADVWLSAVYTPIVMNDRVVKIVMFARDVTEQMVRNADFEGQLAAISQSLLVSTFSPAGVVLDVNPLWLSSYGYGRDDVVGKHESLFVGSTPAARAEHEALWAALREGRVQQGEYSRVGKNGAQVCVYSTYTPIFAPSGVRHISGAVRKVVQFAQDVTSRRQNLQLLTNCLPPSIAAKLKENPDAVIAEQHTDATILFADVVGFSNCCERLPPMQVVAYLNRIFSAFDRLVEELRVEKIKTIGKCAVAPSFLQSLLTSLCALRRRLHGRFGCPLVSCGPRGSDA
jgi:methyl-accepting chemotaxis protein